jgi:hypothetical protein
MFIATEDDHLRLLPTPLSGVRRSIGVTLLKDQTPSAAAAALLSHLRIQGRGLTTPLEAEQQAQPLPD